MSSGGAENEGAQRGQSQIHLLCRKCQFPGFASAIPQWGRARGFIRNRALFLFIREVESFSRVLGSGIAFVLDCDPFLLFFAISIRFGSNKIPLARIWRFCVISVMPRNASECLGIRWFLLRALEAEIAKMSQNLLHFSVFGFKRHVKSCEF